MSEISTGGGSTIGEDVNTDGGDFNNRDKTENANNLSVYFAPQPAPVEQEARGISVTAEESLFSEMRELRQIIGHLIEKLGVLDKTTSLETNSVKLQVHSMSVELDAARSRLNTIESLMKKLEQPCPIFDERLLRSIFYSLIAIVGLLVVIAWLLSGQGIIS